MHGGDKIVRPSKPAHERKQAVTISLSPSDLVILDNLATHLKTHRSGVISQMLVAKGWKDLGLKAADKRAHTAPVQNWPNEYQAKARSFTFDRDAPKACNPAHRDGKCSHQECQVVYRRYGVL